MPWADPRLLVVSSGVSSELQYLSCHVLHDCSEIHRSCSSNSVGVVAPSKQTVNTTNGKRQCCFAAPGPRLEFQLVCFSTTSHYVEAGEQARKQRKNKEKRNKGASGAKRKREQRKAQKKEDRVTVKMKSLKPDLFKADGYISLVCSLLLFC
ncbi:hypothetical protein M513_04986 [Trichuris suis]|uniref:BZIP domain-containing protein n=1 Tax=Trichuris suis TaxID=68888 RepID=A0A085MAG3_9BILA|nr:hypothetical protein M513_04986 [Trichuris suis]